MSECQGFARPVVTLLMIHDPVSMSSIADNIDRKSKIQKQAYYLCRSDEGKGLRLPG